MINRLRQWIYILLFAALLLGGGAVAPVLAANSAPPEGEGEGEAAAPKPGLVALAPLPVPILTQDRVDKYIVVMMSIETPPDADIEAIKHDVPRLNDAFLREAYLAAQENEGAADLDMEALRARLLPLAQSILGNKKMTGLYFTGVSDL